MRLQEDGSDDTTSNIDSRGDYPMSTKSAHKPGMSKRLSLFAKGLRASGATSNLSLLSDLKSEQDSNFEESDANSTTNSLPDRYLKPDGLHWHPDGKE